MATSLVAGTSFEDELSVCITWIPLIGTWALKHRRSGDLHSRRRVESSSKAKVRRLVDTAESLQETGFLDIDSCVAAAAAGDGHRTRERRSNNFEVNETSHARKGRTR